MERASLEQFLDTGWMNGAEFFYIDKIYRVECLSVGGKLVVTVYSWHAKRVSEKEYDDDFTEAESNEWIKVYEQSCSTENEARRLLFEAPLFAGKSFWEAEARIEWLEHI